MAPGRQPSLPEETEDGADAMRGRRELLLDLCMPRPLPKIGTAAQVSSLLSSSGRSGEQTPLPRKCHVYNRYMSALAGAVAGVQDPGFESQ